MDYWSDGRLRERCSNHHPILPLFQYSSLYHLIEEFTLFEGHFAGAFSRPFVLIANQVKHSMDHQKDNHFLIVEAETVRLVLGCFNGNHQVSEEVGMEGREFTVPHGKSEDIGGSISSEMLPIQFSNPGIVDQQDAELRVKKPQFGQYPSGRPSYFS